MEALLQMLHWEQHQPAVSSQAQVSRSVLYTIPFFLMISAVIFGLLTVRAATLSPTSTDNSLGILLLGLIGLHIEATLPKGRYTWVDTALDAGILGLAICLIPSAPLGCAAYYLTLTAALCVLAPANTVVVVGIMLASNLLATITLNAAPPFGQPAGFQTEMVQCFLINLVGFPCLGFIVHTLSTVIKRHEQNLQSAMKVNAELVTGRSRLQLEEKMTTMHTVTESIVQGIDSDLATGHNALQRVDGYVSDALDALAHEEHVPTHVYGLLDDAIDAAATGMTAIRKSASYLDSLHTQGTPDTSIEEFNLVEVMREVTNALRLTYAHYGCELQVSFPKSSITIAGDSVVLADALRQLILNAMESYQSLQEKRERLVWISVSHYSEGAMIEVTDAGCGIPADRVAHIYDRSYTTKGDTTVHGRGMSLVYEVIMQRFGGFIDVVSKEGHGTTVIVTLPACAVGASSELALV